MVYASLTFEVLLYLNTYYFGMFVLCEVGMLIFKGVHLLYPRGVFISDLAMLVFLCCVESTRLFLGRKGNLTQRSLTVLLSIGLTVPSVLGVVYFLTWQTYVLRLEVVLCWLQLVMQSLELFFSLLCITKFYRGGTY